MNDAEVAYEVITLDNNLKRYVFSNNKCPKPDSKPSMTQMGIIHYLIEHIGTDVYQRDLEKVLNIRRSTISGILKTMEKHNIIIRSDSLVDARSKKIELSGQSLKIYSESKELFKKINLILKKGINKEDLDTFLMVIRKMNENMKEDNNDKII